MVENVGLNLFELLPHFIAEEEIHLDRQTELSRLLLRDNQVEILVHNGMSEKIPFDIEAIELNIGG
jgi:hypothetical protein